jgi:hypothetical protein
MPSHKSKGKQTVPTSCTSATPSHTPVLQGQHSDSKVHGRKNVQRLPWTVDNSPIMLSDALDSPSSSDAKSFDEDDMYGSDSGVETISLKRPFQALNVANESPVCTYYLRLSLVSHM